MLNAKTIAQVVLGLGTFVALRASGWLTNWPDIPTGLFDIPISGNVAQVVLSGAAMFLPDGLSRLLNLGALEDWRLLAVRVREIHGRGQTPTPEPAVAEKPAA